MSVAVRRLAGFGLAAVSMGLLGCGGASPAVVPSPAPREAPAVVEETTLPSWGPAVPSVDLEVALTAEIDRRVGAPGLAGWLEAPATEASAVQAQTRALWSLARIGGLEARERLLLELDAGAESRALAAAALLEVPRREAGLPPEPLTGGPWGRLEDGLWTRLALVEPDDLASAEALLLAVARVGGPRSVERMAVELEELPTAEHPEPVARRWAASAQALGLLCARGYGLAEVGAEQLLAGLERDSPAVSSASAYALSRCVRSSGEQLAERRGALVDRLVPLLSAAPDERARLAWRVLAQLGELPPAIPEAILGSSPPPWTVEVEAVRALAGDARGRTRLRAGLLALPLTAFAGPRQHVLLAALEAMRPGVASDGKPVDAELIALGEQLAAGRRSEDPRLRKLAAMALCELRLLQAIRGGELEALRRCAAVEGAPVVELPAAWLANLEVEALLRVAGAAEREARGEGQLGTAPVAGVPGPTADPDRRRRVAALIALARADDPARASVGLQALAEVDDPAVLPVLRAALTRDDPGVVAAAAGAIAARSVDASKRDLEVVPLLEALVVGRHEAADLEARLVAIEALGALARSAPASLGPAGESGSAPDGAPQGEAELGPEPVASPWLARSVLPLAADPAVAVRQRAREALLGHAELLRRFEADARSQAATRGQAFGPSIAANLEAMRAEPVTQLAVETSAGRFVIDFRGAAAPINQANLAALARSGFFEGLSFHRIVPGFVVQGGDPRGDGYGGPGYLVPCEWSNLRYVRGTVGMALAGKDSGGSQFFVTQTPQPHLDARYTVVGRVSEGLEVIDLLLPGDRIIAVEVR